MMYPELPLVTVVLTLSFIVKKREKSFCVQVLPQQSLVFEGRGTNRLTGTTGQTTDERIRLLTQLFWEKRMSRERITTNLIGTQDLCQNPDRPRLLSSPLEPYPRRRDSK